MKLRGLFALSLAGILPAGAAIGASPLVQYAGAAAPWAALVGFIVVLLSAIPVLEYSRIAAFAGGYYGLAELGLGPAAGLFTAVSNYIYYVLWQIQNAMLAGWIVYGMTGLPASWPAAALGALALTLLGAASPPKIYAERVLLVAVGGSTALTLLLSAYVAVMAPPLSSWLNPFEVDWGSVALAAALQGIWLYVGYGAPLFYSEEAAEPERDVWRAVVLALVASSLVYTLTAYALAATRPRPGGAPLYISAWSRYLPSALLALYPLLAAPAAVAYGGPAGSHARLLWAMAREGIIKSDWLARRRRGVPLNAALFNFLLSAAGASALMALFVWAYGPSPESAERAWLAASSTATLTWYYHHVLPQFALYPWLKRRGRLGAREYAVSLAAPALASAFFAFSVYELAAHGRFAAGSLYASLAILAWATAFALAKRGARPGRLWRLSHGAPPQ